ncbi:tetratricopeptide repeat protein [Roseococcus sp. YIM B11640]|uniref:tetratricopeptide repeat protein n=1 Tax=Roseococcus sp. YIM B11640 TaxID=3133973 RepID=UPI003C7BC666
MSTSVIAPPRDPAVLNRLIERGRAMLSDRKTLDAITLLERAVAVPDAPAEAYGLFAEALSEGGREAEALAAADIAIARKQADGMLRLLRARIRRNRGDVPGSMEDAAAAVMADPSCAEAKSFLATCLSEAGRHDEAILLFHQVFAQRPADAHAEAMLAMAFMRAGRHEAAEELFARAQSRQGAERLVVLRAQNAILDGRVESAIAMLEASVLQMPEESAQWAMLAQARQRQGQAELAAEAYRRAAELDPGNGYLAHLATSAGGMTTDADRASDHYVTEVFDGFAARFEGALFALGYRIPGVMLRMIEAHWPGIANGSRKIGDVLDLGCGTGLIGVVLHDLLGGRLVGVDLSQRMLDVARDKCIYTELRRMDALAALEGDGTTYQAVILADVLCYFGALDALFRAARQRVEVGGVLLFSIEAGEEGSRWTLSRNGRYQQSAEYVRACLAAAGFLAADFRDEVLRHENGEPVRGYIVLAEAIS